VDNSIRFKESQVVSGALRKGDMGWFFFLKFQKGFFPGEEVRMDQFHPFPKEFFFKGLREVNFICNVD